ncbi:MAG: hypothetical protein ACNYZG_00425 [Gammaproteobacteria bacterium]
MDTQAYQNAKDALRAGDYKAAERAFKIALDSTNEHIGLSNDGKYNKVQSFYGLAQVLNANENGLLLCRDAASKEKFNGDVFLNLACAELEGNNRKRAIDAIQHGRKIDAAHALLKRACVRLDCRKKCCIGFLPREHRLNRILGRLMRKSGQVVTVHSLLY